MGRRAVRWKFGRRGVAVAAGRRGDGLEGHVSGSRVLLWRTRRRRWRGRKRKERMEEGRREIPGTEAVREGRELWLKRECIWGI